MKLTKKLAIKTMGAGELLKDVWHRESRNVSLRNGIQLRRWGMRVTVYDDPTPANNGDWVLSYNLSSTNKKDNANWLKVADIGATWGGGGASYTFTNGVQESGGTVSMGGPASGPIQIDSTSSIEFNSVDAGVSSSQIQQEPGFIQLSYQDDVTADEFYLTLETSGIILNSQGNFNTSFSLSGTDIFVGSDFGSFEGIKYSADYRSDYTDRSLADWGNVISQIGGNAVDALIQNPTIAQDGYVISWNNTNQEYELVAGGGGTSYTFENAITESGGTVVFGGPMTQDTYVDGVQTYNLYIGDFGSEIVGTYMTNTQAFAAYVTNAVMFLSTTSFAVDAPEVSLQADGGAGIFEIFNTHVDTNNPINWSGTPSAGENLTNKTYVDAHLASRAVDTLVQNPTITQDGYVIAWNNTNLEYELVPQSGGTSYTFANGLTESGGTVIWGGQLTQDTFTYSDGTNRGVYFGRNSGFSDFPVSNFQVLASGTISFNVGSSSTPQTLSIGSNGTVYSQTRSTATNNTNWNIREKILSSTGTVANDFGGREVISVEIGDGSIPTAIMHEYRVVDASGAGVFQWNICETFLGTTVPATSVLQSFNPQSRNIAFFTNNTSFGSGEETIKISNTSTAPSAGVADSALLYTDAGELQVLNATGPVQKLSGRATKVTEAGTAVSLTQAHRGAIVKLTNNSPVTVTLSDLGADFQCTLLYTGSGTVSFAGFTSFNSAGGVDQITSQYGMCYLYHESSNNWYATGDLT